MNHIKEILTNIELHHNVKILYACEAGSRAYGFATESSDYDIRFIYIAPIKVYLSLMKKEDTITNQDDKYDVQGWDLRKALFLAGKSNPSLYEWMLSPIVYRKLDPAMLSLKNVVLTDYSKKVLGYHYWMMIKNNLQAWNKKNEISYLVHAVRATLMLEQVLHFENEPVTINFQDLTEKSNIFTNEELSFLFSLKTGEKVAEPPLISQLLAKVSHFITTSETSITHLHEGKMHLHVLEEMLFQQLGIEGERDQTS
ncbi:nucleotidyltransferase domain-containing protein [Bacillus sp. CHD6a]|uniref:nucleotidyltransferase domain-containing protein n=1 Tax=Bacillus sp. CHD6a TaxID=1643452 RepID=UPI000761E3FB|nr:nucleotidyltransferase domain-containing protein [Bacillus sp. CHD6a]